MPRAVLLDTVAAKLDDRPEAKNSAATDAPVKQPVIEVDPLLSEGDQLL
jgi:hypothetical protein